MPRSRYHKKRGQHRQRYVPQSKKYHNDGSQDTSSSSNDDATRNGALFDHLELSGDSSESNSTPVWQAIPQRNNKNGNHFTKLRSTPPNKLKRVITDKDWVKFLQNEEPAFGIVKQSIVPLLLAGLGMVIAGYYLHHIQRTRVFRRVKALAVLIPALIGLKGNLEMTLASRLSTLYNLGLLSNGPQRYAAFRANFCLALCLAILAGFVATIIGQSVVLMFGLAEFNPNHLLLLFGTCITTTLVATMCLVSITMAMMMISYRFGFNPDNIATPIAAALGDLLTLFVLHGSSEMFFDRNSRFYFGDLTVIMPFFLPGCLSVGLLLYNFAYKCPQTRQGFVDSCFHLLVALVISTCAGLIFDHSSTRFGGLDLYQPVFNGLAGNLGSIQASRMTTYLHKVRGLVKDKSLVKISDDPRTFLFRSDVHSRNARFLMMMAVPLHVVMFMACNYRSPHSTFDLLFLAIYLMAALVQLGFVLFSAEVVVSHAITCSNIDPDNVVIPYLTSSADFLGSLFLLVAFDIFFATPCDEYKLPLHNLWTILS